MLLGPRPMPAPIASLGGVSFWSENVLGVHGGGIILVLRYIWKSTKTKEE